MPLDIRKLRVILQTAVYPDGKRLREKAGRKRLEHVIWARRDQEKRLGFPRGKTWLKRAWKEKGVSRPPNSTNRTQKTILSPSKPKVHCPLKERNQTKAKLSTTTLFFTFFYIIIFFYPYITSYSLFFQFLLPTYSLFAFNVSFLSLLERRETGEEQITLARFFIYLLKPVTSIFILKYF